MHDVKKTKKKSANKYPQRNEKKQSSSKSLIDVKKTKRKSVKNYPRRNEKKGELFKVSD